MQTETIAGQIFERTKQGVTQSSSAPVEGDPKSHQRAVSDLLDSSLRDLMEASDADGKPQRVRILLALKSWAARQRILVELCEVSTISYGGEAVRVLLLTDNRGRRTWRRVDSDPLEAVKQISQERGKKLWLVPSGEICKVASDVVAGGFKSLDPDTAEFLDQAITPNVFEPHQGHPLDFDPHRNPATELLEAENLYLQELESESIAILREAVAAGRNSCMLFSMGKDSMAMLRLAQKAFAPNPVPFPLVVIDTRWKFQDMYRFRQYVADSDLNIIVHINPEAISRDVNPFDHGSATHTQITKTEALRQILDEHGFDIIFGGGRRDEEKSRAKERIFSVRGAGHTWNPREQRPELWSAYNTTLTDEQTLRVFPISNWTEVDIWRYIEQEKIPLVPLYFAKRRPVISRNGSLIAVDDERIELQADEIIDFAWVRFRTLGCYPLTGATYSRALDLQQIVQELELSDTSERISRVIDFDNGASMEQKKREGYF
jgi:sulfate adenylyltransferase subunit 2